MVVRLLSWVKNSGIESVGMILSLLKYCTIINNIDIFKGQTVLRNEVIEKKENQRNK